MLIKLISYWPKHPSLSHIQCGKQNPKIPHTSHTHHTKRSAAGDRTNIHIKNVSGGKPPSFTKCSKGRVLGAREGEVVKGSQ